jgi:hypothetical protein
MSSLQRRIAALTHSTADLIAQLRELDRLREQVRKAQLISKRSTLPKRRNGNGTPLLSAEGRDLALMRSGPTELNAQAPKRAAMG